MIYGLRTLTQSTLIDLHKLKNQRAYGQHGSEFNVEKNKIQRQKLYQNKEKQNKHDVKPMEDIGDMFEEVTQKQNENKIIKLIEEKLKS